MEWIRREGAVKGMCSTVRATLTADAVYIHVIFVYKVLNVCTMMMYSDEYT